MSQDEKALMLQIAGFLKVHLQTGFITPAAQPEARELLEKIGSVLSQ